MVYGKLILYTIRFKEIMQFRSAPAKIVWTVEFNLRRHHTETVLPPAVTR